MSLSTLLEAAKYLDYLDSNNHQQQVQQQQQQLKNGLVNQPQPIHKKSSGRRARASRKNAPNSSLAMSLPASSGQLQAHGVPIPTVATNGESQQATSLSSSLTTGSPLSSFASTALLCSKVSGITSASSSAASSLSSSDSSSSCGEILMGDNDFNPTTTTSSNSFYHSNGANHHDYHITHQSIENNHPVGDQQQTFKNQMATVDNISHQSVARYIAATSSGPQLVTMTTSSASTPIEGKMRSGHVINAVNESSLGTPCGGSFDSRRFDRMHNDGQSFNMAAGSFVSDREGHLSSSPGSCPPFIMARIQPMILNSLSPSTQSIMAFQPTTASSPTSSSSSYSRHRELHKTLEKNRRAHLRHCFELLKAELPASECADKKTSHINIIKSAIRYVLTLRQQECEIENELQRLTKIKSQLTESLSRGRSNCNHPSQQQQQQSSSISVTSDQLNAKQDQNLQQPAAPEQQLSFLLSQSKID